MKSWWPQRVFSQMLVLMKLCQGPTGTQRGGETDIVTNVPVTRVRVKEGVTGTTTAKTSTQRKLDTLRTEMALLHNHTTHLHNHTMLLHNPMRPPPTTSLPTKLPVMKHLPIPTALQPTTAEAAAGAVIPST